MEVRSVWETNDLVRANGACEQLRVHGIKCDVIEPTIPYLPGPFTSRGEQINVVVAPEDEDRANKILDAWAESL